MKQALVELNRGSAKNLGAPRWMVTFADLMALLLTFFVLLLSFAEIDHDTFMENAGPMRSAFNQGGGILIERSAIDRTIAPSDAVRRADYETWTNKTYDRLQILLADDITRGVIDLERKEKEVVVRLPSGTTFKSGGIELSEEAKTALVNVAQVLSERDGFVTVSGHTDDIPIRSSRFRSNWDLSAARSVSVVHYLLDNGPLKPERVMAAALADSRPLVPNDSPANRAVNRRVEIGIRFPEPTAEESKKPWYLRKNVGQ